MNWKGVVVLVLALVLLTTSIAMADGGGFDQFGYNYQANIFVGTGLSWCQQKGFTDVAQCNRILGGPYSYDNLVMKWSPAWDAARFFNQPWTCDAWIDNEWNGNVPGGSGYSEHYKIVWVGPTLQASSCWRPGGYPVWGEFEVVFDQGMSPTDGHLWYAHATPNGYGGYP